MALPSVFGSNTDSNNKTDQDQVTEDGRVRSYPHERGQWTLHIHASCEFLSLSKEYQIVNKEHFFFTVNTEASERLEEILSEEVESTPGVKIMDDFHLSLFRGHCVVRYHHIPLILESLTESLSKISPFTVVLNDVKILSNDENTRKFISVCDKRCFVDEGSEVKQLLECIDKIFRQFVSLKVYEEPFILHSSLLWFKPSDEIDTIQDILSNLQVKFMNILTIILTCLLSTE